MITPECKRMNHEQYKQFVTDHLNEQKERNYDVGSEVFYLRDFFFFLPMDNVVNIIGDAEVNNRRWVQITTGRTSKDPACMFRALLLARLLKLQKPEDLAKKLENTTYAAICGFDTTVAPTDFRSPPGAQTIRDFCKRLWNSPTSSIAESNIREPHAKPQRPLVDGEKADPIEKDTCEDRINRYENTEFDLAKEAYGPLFIIFYELGLKASRACGVLDPEIRHGAGDGMPIQILARERSFRVCLVEDPKGTRCPCKDRKTRSDCPYRDMAIDGKLPCEWSEELRRFFTHPDLDVGWDSSRKCFVIGHDMYMFTDAKSGLPLFGTLNPASMHDSFGLIETFYRFKNYAPDFVPQEMSLDSAHDVSEIYLMLARNSIVPFVDLNSRGSKSVRLPPKFTLNEHSTPVCPLGCVMAEIGVDVKKGKTKFGCPCMEKKDGKKCCTCKCAELCPKSKPTSYISVPTELLLKCDTDKTNSGPPDASPVTSDTCNCGKALKQPGFTMWHGSVFCPQGMEMRPNGTDQKRGLVKFRCPMMSKDDNGNPVCTCKSPCEGGGKYGKDICVHYSEDPRYLTTPRRDTEEWKKIYNQRTSAERDNKRVKVDFLFELSFTSNTMMCYISMYLIFIILHVQAQMKAAAADEHAAASLHDAFWTSA